MERQLVSGQSERIAIDIDADVQISKSFLSGLGGKFFTGTNGAASTRFRAGDGGICSRGDDFSVVEFFDGEFQAEIFSGLRQFASCDCAKEELPKSVAASAISTNFVVFGMLVLYG